ncbi:MAG TPA: hypothetical protein VFW76_03375 [Ktedonobacterales bacterium]|nr:hypothetical protein [Ktedonobacterales bacterium]
MSTPLMAGISARVVETPRLRTYALTAGDESGAPVVFVHGNVSSARFFEETMLAMPPGYWSVAPDLRGLARARRSQSTPRVACATSPTTCAPSWRRLA